VLRFWLDRGVDGVRLDSINRLGKDPAYRDNVEGEPARQQNWPTLHDHLREVRTLVNESGHGRGRGDLGIRPTRHPALPLP
jgi:alpha-glucosidase